MEITASLRLFGKEWNDILEYLVNHKDEPMFETYFDIFYLCASIGIYYDEISEIPNDEYVREIPRIVLINRVQKMDYLYQIAVLSTKHLSLEEKERTNLAFDTNKSKEFGELKFLIKFANYGMKKLYEHIDFKSTLATIDQINSYCKSLVEGYDIDKILQRLSA